MLDSFSGITSTESRVLSHAYMVASSGQLQMSVSSKEGNKLLCSC